MLIKGLSFYYCCYFLHTVSLQKIHAMNHAARIQSTIDLLERIAKARIPMDSVCGDYFRTRKYIGAKDRADIAERVYAVMRAHARICWWLAKMGADDSPRNRVIVWLVLGEGRDAQALFTGDKHAPTRMSEEKVGFVRSLLTSVSSTDFSRCSKSPSPRGEDGPSDKREPGEGSGGMLSHPDMPLSVRAECPPQYEESLKNYFGDEFENEMAAMIPPATLDLRVNVNKASREKAQNYLEADGVKTELTPYSPWGLRCENKAFLSRTKAFSQGWIEIQDEGSQMIALAVDPKPGMSVLDYCAGAGGKTLALAAAMNVKGRIVAMDTEERRLQKGKERFRKAGVSDIIETRALSDDKNRKWLRRQKGTFDAVLCDVPCTGTGTWRRNPDMRWRTYGPSLEELIEIQADILDRVAHTVKPGGRLVYATCSLLPEENERQIEAFLGRHAGFELVDGPLTPTLSPGRGRSAEGAEGEGIQPCEDSPYMRLTPHRHNTDGFFAAAIQKKDVE